MTNTPILPWNGQGRAMRREWLIGMGLLMPLADRALAESVLPTVIRPDAVPMGRQEGVQLATDGHFRLRAVVNGTPLPMLFDTGASTVVLRAEDAARLGIDTDSLAYSITVGTANGRARAAPLTLASLTVGGITRRDVVAMVAQPGRLADNLLGQSFLSRLGGYRQEGSRLVFLDRP